MKNSASGVMNGVRHHWTHNGSLPSPRESLERKIREGRDYAQHTRRYGELAELEKQYVESFGLLAFVRLFDWFSLYPNSETVIS